MAYWIDSLTHFPSDQNRSVHEKNTRERQREDRPGRASVNSYWIGSLPWLLGPKPMSCNKLYRRLEPCWTGSHLYEAVTARLDERAGRTVGM